MGGGTAARADPQVTVDPAPDGAGGGPATGRRTARTVAEPAGPPMAGAGVVVPTAAAVPGAGEPLLP